MEPKGHGREKTMVDGVERGDWCPDWAPHPGKHLMEMLDTRHWTDTDLARATGLWMELIRRVIAGTIPVSQKTARHLERVLELKASMWINLQTNRDVAQRRKFWRPRNAERGKKNLRPVTSGNLMLELRRINWCRSYEAALFYA